MAVMPFGELRTRPIIALRAGNGLTAGKSSMSWEILRQINRDIEADATSRPFTIEFEMAYQARVAIDRIRFAIRHAETVCQTLRGDARGGMQLLDALQRPLNP